MRFPRTWLLFWLALGVAAWGLYGREAGEHWAFVPPVAPEVPRVAGEAWVVNDIDRFVLFKLESLGLSPSPRADRRTLIRRASFDLTGLPPTAAEVAAFVEDESPDAYAKLIDRLLDSPHYGERWGRYWLDLARYADTKGYVYADREYPRFVHSHVYRDWVVRAINEDLPYDKFLLYQLAADQIEEGQPQSFAAMGFLTLGRRFLGVVPDIVDDRIDVMSRTTQGLTVSCARCHDHKYDPIPTADYYSLYGIFTASTESAVPLTGVDENDPKQRAFIEGLKARQEKLNKRLESLKARFAERMRDQVAEYFGALPGVESLPTDEFYEIRNSKDLVPTVVRRWQAFLFTRSRSGFDRIFQPWHEAVKVDKSLVQHAVRRVLEEHGADSSRPLNAHVLRALSAAAPGSLDELARAYGQLLHETVGLWKAEQKPDVSPVALHDVEWEELRQVLYGRDSPTQVPTGSVYEVEWLFEEPVRVELAKLQSEIDKWIVTSPGATPHAVVLRDRPTQPNPRVFVRGNPASPGQEVPRQYLHLISGAHREPFHAGSGRLEMARIITNRDNPLTARVMVNRVWMHHLGRGLVETASDFGLRCPPPSHPELLDNLALRFVDNGWSLKSLHRLIMTSATYMQSSADRADGYSKDPENRWLGRANIRRLDFEAMRDSMLAVTGELDRTLGGPGVELFGAEPKPRRTIYGLVDRQFLPGPYRVFDFSNPDLHTPNRPSTTVPQQALFLINSPFMQQRAMAVGQSIASMQISDEERIRVLYRRLFQREAEPHEISQGLRFIQASQAITPVVAAPPPPVLEWQYGYGRFDVETQRTAGFTPLPHFTGDAWQGGASWPDAKLGWVRLTAEGGHAGNDIAHAAIRRWVAPRNGRVRIAGTVAHTEAAGDGIRARVVSSRQGPLVELRLRNTSAESVVEEINLRQGDTLDFSVDLLANLNSDMFTWPPRIEYLDAPEKSWSAEADFTHQAPLPPLSEWEQYAQVLLLSNEFMFVD